MRSKHQALPRGPICLLLEYLLNLADFLLDFAGEVFVLAFGCQVGVVGGLSRFLFDFSLLRKTADSRSHHRSEPRPLERRPNGTTSPGQSTGVPLPAMAGAVALMAREWLQPSRPRANVQKRGRSTMLILIIILLVVLGGGGGYYGHSRWGYGGGAGIGLGTILLILLIAYMLGLFH